MFSNEALHSDHTGDSLTRNAASQHVKSFLKQLNLFVDYYVKYFLADESSEPQDIEGVESSSNVQKKQDQLTFKLKLTPQVNSLSHESLITTNDHGHRSKARWLERISFLSSNQWRMNFLVSMSQDLYFRYLNQHISLCLLNLHLYLE
jgi:hypothetical protein